MTMPMISDPALAPTGAAARLVSRAPTAVRPYLELMRLDSPRAAWLVVLPGWIAATLAAAGRPDWRVLAVLTVHGILGRSAGCTVNDITDRRFDPLVPRTAGRPLASGRLTLPQAWAWFAVQAAVVTLIPLALGVGPFLLLTAGWILVVGYPFMKRITDWPQLWLGLTINWYVPAAWLAVTGRIGVPALVLHLGLACWTAGYDTIYAHQDRAADITAGVRSTAVRLGGRTRLWVAMLYLAAGCCVAAAGWLAGVHVGLLPLLLPAAAHLVWQVATLDIGDPANCRRRFGANVWFGVLVGVGLAAGKAFS